MGGRKLVDLNFKHLFQRVLVLVVFRVAFQASFRYKSTAGRYLIEGFVLRWLILKCSEDNSAVTTVLG